MASGATADPGLGYPGDVLIAISTSGRSPNIRAIAATGEQALTVVGFTAGPAARWQHAAIFAYMPRRIRRRSFQQIHITAGHIICDLVEERLFPRANAQ